MSLTKSNFNTNTISSLDDKPTISSSELKSKFDYTAVQVKDYLNNTLTEELDTKLNSIDGSISNMNTSIETINTTLNSNNEKLLYTNTDATSLNTVYIYNVPKMYSVYSFVFKEPESNDYLQTGVMAYSLNTGQITMGFKGTIRGNGSNITASTIYTFHISCNFNYHVTGQVLTLTDINAGYIEHKKNGSHSDIKPLIIYKIFGIV